MFYRVQANRSQRNQCIVLEDDGTLSETRWNIGMLGRVDFFDMQAWMLGDSNDSSVVVATLQTEHLCGDACSNVQLPDGTPVNGAAVYIRHCASSLSVPISLQSCTRGEIFRVRVLLFGDPRRCIARTRWVHIVGRTRAPAQVEEVELPIDVPEPGASLKRGKPYRVFSSEALPVKRVCVDTPSPGQTISALRCAQAALKLCSQV